MDAVAILQDKSFLRFTMLQQTLKKEIYTNGVGVHSGDQVTVKIKPAPADHGIKFIRTDLASGNVIDAKFDSVVDTRLCTVIENASGASVSTIEHIMSAFYGMGIDNAIVEINAQEMAIMDGSSAPFVALIDKAGTITQDRTRHILKITKPVSIEDGDKFISIAPADEFTIDCSIEFPHPVIGKQAFSFSFARDSYNFEVSRARTFGFAHEIEALRKMGLAKGGSLENAIGIDENGVMNPEGLRYVPDEFVRHKVLDCIGDLYLSGAFLQAKVVAHKPSHALNNLILRKLFAMPECYEFIGGEAVNKTIAL